MVLISIKTRTIENTINSPKYHTKNEFLFEPLIKSDLFFDFQASSSKLSSKSISFHSS